MNLSLRQAERHVTASKSTILRAIQSGRLSASRDETGAWAIDPAELCRVFEPVAGGPVRDTSQTGPRDDPDRGHETGETLPGPPDPAPDPAAINAKLEAELSAMRMLLEAERARSDELRSERDRWANQAERLALTAPKDDRGMLARLFGRAA